MRRLKILFRVSFRAKKFKGQVQGQKLVEKARVKVSLKSLKN